MAKKRTEARAEQRARIIKLRKEKFFAATATIESMAWNRHNQPELCPLALTLTPIVEGRVAVVDVAVVVESVVAESEVAESEL